MDLSKHVAPVGVGDAMKQPHTADADCGCKPTWNGDSWIHHETWVEKNEEVERVN